MQAAIDCCARRRPNRSHHHRTIRVNCLSRKSVTHCSNTSSAICCNNLPECVLLVLVVTSQTGTHFDFAQLFLPPPPQAAMTTAASSEVAVRQPVLDMRSSSSARIPACGGGGAMCTRDSPPHIALYEYTTIDAIGVVESGYDRLQWRCPVPVCATRPPFPLYDERILTDRVVDHLMDHFYQHSTMVRVYTRDDTRLWPPRTTTLT